MLAIPLPLTWHQSSDHRRCRRENPAADNYSEWINLLIDNIIVGCHFGDQLTVSARAALRREILDYILLPLAGNP